MEAPDDRPAIAIVDYGMGNRRSVEKALEHVGARARITRDPTELRAADGLVVPGVGAFPKAMENLRALGLDELVRERAERGGAASSASAWDAAAVRLLRGARGRRGPGPAARRRCAQLDAGGCKLPHIGWNLVRLQRDSRAHGRPARRDAPSTTCTLRAAPGRAVDDVLGASEYGEPFVCAVARDPLFGVQFHPEKSSTHGLALLRNFAAVCARVAA